MPVPSAQSEFEGRLKRVRPSGALFIPTNPYKAVSLNASRAGGTYDPQTGSTQRSKREVDMSLGAKTRGPSSRLIRGAHS